MPGQPRTAMITGSAGGLGRAIALALARRGWHLALADVDQAGNAETAAQVAAAGGHGLALALDVTRQADWQAAHDRLRGLWPQLDLLANNAGVACAGEVGACPLDDWNWVLDTNLRGTLLGCHTFVAWLKKNPRGGHILNTASAAAFVAAPTMAAYNVSKAGVVTLSETLYAELAAQRVGVTVVCPGFFSTGLLEAARFQTDAQRRLAENLTRQARFSADDVAAAALAGVERKQLYVVLPARARRWWRMKRWFPAAFMRIVARRFAQGLPETL